MSRLVRRIAICLTYPLHPNYFCNHCLSKNSLCNPKYMTKINDKYHISLVVRQRFISSKTILKIYIHLISSQNNPKNLHPSHKMDVDFWGCFRMEKLILQQNFIRLSKIFGVIIKRENTVLWMKKYGKKSRGRTHCFCGFLCRFCLLFSFLCLWRWLKHRNTQLRLGHYWK